MRVFLGGTCNGSIWRDSIIPLLKVDYFNPVVKDWTPECQAREIEERENCDVCLYVITPKMTGVYSIAEVVDDSNKRPSKTMLVLLSSDGDAVGWSQHQWKSLKTVGDLVARNGGKVFYDLTDAANEINLGSICSNCGGRWEDHDFGVPSPSCP